MKKIYLLLPIFFLASCSSSDNETDTPNNNGNGNDSSPVLVTKMVSDGDISTFTYSGTKISQSKNLTDGSITNYTYTGDLITQTVTSSSGSTFTTTYTYDGSNRLSKKKSVHTAPGLSATYEVNYTYTGSNNVKMVVTSSSTGSSNVTTYTRNATLNADGSLGSWTETVTAPTYTGNGTLKPIVYDTKNTPFKNVTGYLKIIDQEEENGSTHNILDYNSVLQYSGTTGGEWSIFKSTYEYNASNYPIKDTRKYYDKTGTTVTSTEINTYEYNHL
ncbi:YD repeat-containing protein [Chryseobacterium oranimense]|uniref:YD repeat-containing protein n=1 Tax=Chryseobacterium oranimense TaxID=421058 RepID=A0A1M5PZ76_9FLAO|nr:hypothetical protein [Chryseobacterium oranimense]SHH06779.1 YD repeat-containing protein [Chryseobacterium oranimense]